MSIALFFFLSFLRIPLMAMYLCSLLITADFAVGTVYLVKRSWIMWLMQEHTTQTISHNFYSKLRPWCQNQGMMWTWFESGASLCLNWACINCCIMASVLCLYFCCSDNNFQYLLFVFQVCLVDCGQCHSPVPHRLFWARRTLCSTDAPGKIPENFVETSWRGEH